MQGLRPGRMRRKGQEKRASCDARKNPACGSLHATGAACLCFCASCGGWPWRFVSFGPLAAARLARPCGAAMEGTVCAEKPLAYWDLSDCAAARIAVTPREPAEPAGHLPAASGRLAPCSPARSALLIRLFPLRPDAGQALTAAGACGQAAAAPSLGPVAAVRRGHTRRVCRACR